MTYAELITSMLENQCPDVLANAYQAEEIGWGL